MNYAPTRAGRTVDATTATRDAAAWNADPANARVPMVAMAGPYPFGTYGDDNSWSVYLIDNPRKAAA